MSEMTNAEHRALRLLRDLEMSESEAGPAARAVVDRIAGLATELRLTVGQTSRLHDVCQSAYLAGRVDEVHRLEAAGSLAVRIVVDGDRAFCAEGEGPADE